MNKINFKIYTNLHAYQCARDPLAFLFAKRGIQAIPATHTRHTTFPFAIYFYDKNK